MKFDDLIVLKSHPIQRPAVLISENILYFSDKAFNFFEKEFEEYKQMAYAKGFLMVASSPLTRSSYHASDDFKIMQNKRKEKLHSIQ